MASLNTKVAVKALISYLVDPLLPLTISNVPPSHDNEMAVAKQMQAVVLLYNYYHRKQKPELPFLDFASFCKVAVAVKEPLVSFMKPQMLNDLIPDDQLSMTEKAIKDACDIADALDASRDLPDIEGWPISKVAVLLIDAQKENCLLRNGFVTQGVWAPLEKEVDEPSVCLGTSGKQMVGRKRMRSVQRVLSDDVEAHLNQLAYDAIKEATGFESSDLEVLETHLTYNLTKYKTATQLYMMQYCGSFSVELQTPVSLFFDESLQGPLVKNLPDEESETTQVVEYYHMLPYLEFASCWLSGECANENEHQEIGVHDNQGKEDLSAQNRSTHISDDEGGHLKVDVSNPLNSDHHPCKDSKESGCKIGAAAMSNQDIPTLPGNLLGQFDADNVNADVERVHPVSEELQNALALLYRKTQENCSQICNHEGMLAQYEDIIARIRDGGDVALDRQCNKSIINGNGDLLSPVSGNQNKNKCDGKSKQKELPFAPPPCPSSQGEPSSDGSGSFTPHQRIALRKLAYHLTEVAKHQTEMAAIFRSLADP